MTLVDVNLLLHAYNPRSDDHAAAKAWLEETLTGTAPVRFAWVSLWAFVRITTHPRVFEHPFSRAEATAAVEAWLQRPSVAVLGPGERHWDILKEVMNSGQVTGPLVMDAALASLAIEHGATLMTTDRDFARFEGLRWENPLTHLESQNS